MANFYPTALPAPAVATLTPDEQRLISKLDGARLTRAHQRDRLGTIAVRWPPLSYADAATLLSWGRDDLTLWSAMFSAAWSLPWGGTGVFRFLEAPVRTLVPGVGWQLSALVEVRGVGALPESCYGPWLTMSAFGTPAGSNTTAGFTQGTVGPAAGFGLSIASASQVGPPSFIRRTISPVVGAVSHVSFKVRCTSLGTDDGTTLLLLSGASTAMSFVPIREPAFDAARRPGLYVDGGGVFGYAGSAQITIGTWYQVDVRWGLGAIQSRMTIADATTGLLFASGAFTSPAALPTVDSMEFFNDCIISTNTCATEYADLRICAGTPLAA